MKMSSGLRTNLEIGVFSLALVLLIAWLGVRAGAWDTCESECAPYTVALCSHQLAVCKTVDGYSVKEKKGKF